MAGLQLEIPEDYLKELLDHSFDDIAKTALKAIWLEYGRVGQSPSPWLAPAVQNCKDKIMSEMQKIWEKETGTS